MSRWHEDGRSQSPELPVRVRAEGDARLWLCAPAVGLWRERPAPGARLFPGASAGTLEILGVAHRLRVPPGAAGLVLPYEGPVLARAPVAFDDPLLALDLRAGMSQGETAAAASGPAQAGGPVLRAPTSGRFYRRPAPDQDAFVAEGDVITAGQVVGLLEVMKTFSRLTYEGAGLPSPARVLRLLPADGDDVDEGDPIVEVEPA